MLCSFVAVVVAVAFEFCFSVGGAFGGATREIARHVLVGAGLSGPRKPCREGLEGGNHEFHSDLHRPVSLAEGTLTLGGEELTEMRPQS